MWRKLCNYAAWAVFAAQPLSVYSLEVVGNGSLQLTPALRGGSVPKTFSLRSNSLMCIDVPGGHAQKAGEIELWECNGHSGQLWIFDADAWQIQYAADPTKCLDAGVSPAQGSIVMIWDCNGLQQQAWGYDEKQGSVYLKYSSSDASLCLDAFSDQKAGNKLQVWTCNGYPQQQFNVMYGTTIRVNQDYHQCLDLEGGTAKAGTSVQIWGCNGLANQQWIFYENTGQIVYGGNGGNPALCLDSHDMQAGSHLMLWDCNGQAQQKFGYDATKLTIYLPSSNARDFLGAPLAANCLDLLGGSLAPGAAVQVYTCNGCWNQQFTLGGGVTPQTQDGEDLQHSSNKVLPPSNSCPPKPGEKPGVCVNGWPTFPSLAALQNNAWGNYFKTVYGAIPTDPSFYPLCLGDLWMFYTTVMTSSKVAGVPKSVGTCPSKGGKTAGEYYAKNNQFSPPGVAWSWHPLPHVAFKANTWVEVIHMQFVSDEHFGAWFFYARGGGIWFNLGKTFAVTDHADAYKKLGAHNNEDMCKKGAAAGWDSIQFLAHSDGEFGCRANPGQASMNYELVSTKLKGMYPCASADGKSPLLKAGWHSKPCVCSNSAAKFLNCQGVPTFAVNETILL